MSSAQVSALKNNTEKQWKDLKCQLPDGSPSSIHHCQKSAFVAVGNVSCSGQVKLDYAFCKSDWAADFDIHHFTR